MKLEDILIDYVSVYPNGNTLYIEYYLKIASDIELETFVKNFVKEKYHTTLINYMNNFLGHVKVELVNRMTRQYASKFNLSSS